MSQSPCPPEMVEKISTIATDVSHIRGEVQEIKQQVTKINGSVRANTTAIAVMQDWRQTQVVPAQQEQKDKVEELGKGQVDIKVQLARLLVIAGGFGGGVALLTALLEFLKGAI